MTYILHLSSPFGPRGAHCCHNCGVIKVAQKSPQVRECVHHAHEHRGEGQGRAWKNRGNAAFFHLHPPNLFKNYPHHGKMVSK